MDPSSQKKLFGHNSLFNHLKNLNEIEKLPNKILLSGQKGIGKSTLAYHFINFILSKGEDYSYDFNNFEINPQNKSFKLLQNQSSLNFNLIDIVKDKRNIDVDQIRTLISNHNKSSFDLRKRFILIDNIELLNKNSVNALLKFLEEPNDNINFILINNNIMTPATLKSRCLNFKVSLTHKNSIKITSQIINDDISNFINYELINKYSTPGEILRIIRFSQEYNINIKDINLNSFLSIIIKNKLYKKEKLINNIIYSFIELYFINNLSNKDFNLIYLYEYFIKKIYNTKIYNLDNETLFMEFQDRVLGG